MNENKEKEIKKEEYNTPIPTVNYNGTPNFNTMTQQDTSKNKVRVRRPLQQNSYMMNLRSRGYIRLQILIIILTLATILGVIIGATIYVYTK